MKNENFDFIDYCKSRGFFKKANGNLQYRKKGRDLEMKFSSGRYIISITPDFYFAKEIPVTQNQADDQFDIIEKVSGINLQPVEKKGHP